MMALRGRRLRSRTIIHEVGEEDVLKELSVYGVMAYMLPTEIGGTVEFDWSEWIANRRAVEMREI